MGNAFRVSAALPKVRSAPRKPSPLGPVLWEPSTSVPSTRPLPDTPQDHSSNPPVLLFFFLKKRKKRTNQTAGAATWLPRARGVHPAGRSQRQLQHPETCSVPGGGGAGRRRGRVSKNQCQNVKCLARLLGPAPSSTPGPGSVSVAKSMRKLSLVRPTGPDTRLCWLWDPTGHWRQSV